MRKKSDAFSELSGEQLQSIKGGIVQIVLPVFRTAAVFLAAGAWQHADNIRAGWNRAGSKHY